MNNRKFIPILLITLLGAIIAVIYKCKENSSETIAITNSAKDIPTYSKPLVEKEPDERSIYMTCVISKTDSSKEVAWCGDNICIHMPGTPREVGDTIVIQLQ